MLFDYGGTLVDFYRGDQFPGVLRSALSQASSVVLEGGESVPPDEILWSRVSAEDYERPDHRVRPLEDRLARIFGISDTAVLEAASAAFTRVVRARGTVIRCAHRVLVDLTRRGYRLGLVSNTPWGCPGAEWLGDLEARGLKGFFEQMISCRDVGYRKPAPEVYRHVIELFGVEAGECLFVGDDAEWDLRGPRNIGMDALLLDRWGRQEYKPSVRTLAEVIPYLDV